MNQLELAHLEYDLGSEQVMLRFGSVKKDQLIVGERSYSKVILPPGMENINESTRQLLVQFIDQGGEVLCLSDSLNYEDGTINGTLVEFAEGRTGWQLIHADQMVEITNWFDQKEFKLESKGSQHVYHQRRQLKNGEVLFIVNSSLSDAAQIEITWNVNSVTSIDLLTGTTVSLPYSVENNVLSLQSTLEPAASLLLVSRRKIGKPAAALEPISTELSSSSSVLSKRLDDNVLTLDYLDLTTDDFYEEDQYFMNAMYRLFEWSELPTGNPWQHKIQFKQTYLKLDQFNESSWHRMQYEVEIDSNIDPQSLQSIKLVAERPDIWSVNVNGNQVKPSDQWWLDRHFPVYLLDDLLKTGFNTIELRAEKMSVFAEIMPVYLLGDFSLEPTEKGFKICPPRPITTGSWTDNGFPFYSNSMSYEQSFIVEDQPDTATITYTLEADWKGTVAEVLINNKPGGTWAWGEQYDVTQYIEPGKNTITLIVTGSLKNTLGFHHKELERWIDGPFSRNIAPTNQPPGTDYKFMDYGLFGELTLIQSIEYQ